MSGLVGYESSNDEGENPKDVTTPPLLVGAVEDAEKSSSLPTKSNVLGADLSDAPVSGPTMSADGFGTTELAHESPVPENMSERDALRYLTQATHPMISMPPSPPGSPDPATNARFRRFLDLKKKGIHFNEDLAKKPTFRNPSLLASMMERAGVAESQQYNTSLPTRLWDHTVFPDFAYKEGLLRTQQEVNETLDKAQKSANGKRTIDFTSASQSGQSSRASTPGDAIKRTRL